MSTDWLDLPSRLESELGTLLAYHVLMRWAEQAQNDGDEEGYERYLDAATRLSRWADTRVIQPRSVTVAATTRREEADTLSRLCLGPDAVRPDAC